MTRAIEMEQRLDKIEAEINGLNADIVRLYDMTSKLVSVRARKKEGSKSSSKKVTKDEA